MQSDLDVADFVTILRPDDIVDSDSCIAANLLQCLAILFIAVEEEYCSIVVPTGKGLSNIKQQWPYSFELGPVCRVGELDGSICNIIYTQMASQFGFLWRVYLLQSQIKCEVVKAAWACWILVEPGAILE